MGTVVSNRGAGRQTDCAQAGADETRSIAHATPAPSTRRWKATVFDRGKQLVVITGVLCRDKMLSGEAFVQASSPRIGGNRRLMETG